MPLTNTTIRNAKSGEKAIRLFDGGGLYLEVAPSGGKWWRFKYRFGGKERRLSLGVYPEVSLARAREWYQKQLPTWTPAHAVKVIGFLERNAFPWLGHRPIREIMLAEVLAAARRIEGRGATESAHRTVGCIGMVFKYATASGMADSDPTRDIRGALSPTNEKHFASVTDPRDVGELQRALDGYTGAFVTRCALRFAPLTFVRPGELRQAEWAEINFKKSEWRIPAHKMKMGSTHIVPLSRQRHQLSLSSWTRRLPKPTAGLPTCPRRTSSWPGWWT